MTEHDRSRIASLRTLNSTLASAAEHLEVVGIPDEQHIPSFGTRAIDDAVKLQRPRLATLKRDPGVQGIVSGRNNDSTTCLASSECLEKGWSKICGLIRFRAIIHNVAALLSRFGRVSG